MFDFKKLQQMQKELQSRMAKAQEEMAAKTVEASSGGGVVTAVVNGNQEVLCKTLYHCRCGIYVCSKGKRAGTVL